MNSTPTPSGAVRTAPARRPAAGSAAERATGPAADPAKPRLRGAIHAAVAPLALAVGIVLVALAPTAATRWADAVFGLTAVLLFGTSAVYHRGRWSPQVAGVLRRIDHTNIFLVIAGTYTALSVTLLDPRTARTLLIIIWTGALAGLVTQVFWRSAPRWLTVALYVVLGWTAVWYLREFWRAGGPTIVWLIIAGGLAYTLGALVYALRRPDPNPRWFGFHEVFHTLTVAGFTCHCVAVSIATNAGR